MKTSGESEQFGHGSVSLLVFSDETLSSYFLGSLDMLSFSPVAEMRSLPNPTRGPLGHSFCCHEWETAAPYYENLANVSVGLSRWSEATNENGLSFIPVGVYHYSFCSSTHECTDFDFGSVGTGFFTWTTRETDLYEVEIVGVSINSWGASQGKANGFPLRCFEDYEEGL